MGVDALSRPDVGAALATPPPLRGEVYLNIPPAPSVAHSSSHPERL